MSSNPFSLLDSDWIPVRRRSGARCRIAPHRIVEDFATDPVVRPDWGRADLDAATLEFLIGLLAVASPPGDMGAWIARFRTPPAPEALAGAFAPFAHAFRLDGEGPRFLQDLDPLDGEVAPVSGLFVEAPGANTEKNNADLFQKRGRLGALGLPAAAIALFTLQAYAPSGGAGHRTSLRGGGPLTTLALPPDDDTLWRFLWLNVPQTRLPLPADLSLVFPWLAPTRTSEGKAPPLIDDDIDPRGAFWGMPRRIRLVFEPAPAGSVCALTGAATDVLVTGYRTRPWGMNYGQVSHPLSPMYRQKVGAEWLFLHPQPGGLTYRHWIDMATEPDPETALRRAAPVIHIARERLVALETGRGRLRAAGYDMDNMKARGFVEAEFPLFARPGLDEFAHLLVAGAQDVASLAAGAVKDALGLDATDGAMLSALREDFYARTQDAFFAALEAQSAGPDDPDAPVLAFLDDALRKTALKLFDRHAPLLRPEARGAERIATARLALVLALAGHGKRGKSLFGKLSLPVPVKAKEEVEA